MKANVTNPAAVAAGAVVTWLGTFKCCALPALFSLLGLTGSMATLFARWLAPGLPGLWSMKFSCRFSRE